MPMKILLVLVLYSVLSLSKSEPLERSTIPNVSERKRLPLFPKLNIKYTVKPDNTENNLEFQKTSENTNTRKPLMTRMVPRTKKTVDDATEAVTRQPLMKSRSFTGKMRSIKKETIDKTHKQKHIRRLTRSLEVKSDSQNNMTQKSKLIEDNLNKLNKNIIITSLVHLGITGDNSEEDKDKHEFIFLGKNKVNKFKDLLNGTDGLDTTTIRTKAGKLRRIRNSNIIEEENMGTTVSPLKYTGRDCRLSNNLYFKNINH